MSENNVFSQLSDDVVLNILYKLEEDPRHWARIACVSTKFAALIRTVCCRTRCAQAIPAVAADLLSSAGGAWSSLYKLAVCCPGLLHAGVLLENSDFGLERELGPDENFRRNCRSPDGNRRENRAGEGSDGNLQENGPGREGPDGNRRENRARESPDGNQEEFGWVREGPIGNQQENRAFESSDGNQDGNRALENPDGNLQGIGPAREGTDGNLQENRAGGSSDWNQEENGRASESPYQNERENRARESPDGKQREIELAREGPIGNQQENRAGGSSDWNQEEIGQAREGSIGNQRENRAREGPFGNQQENRACESPDGNLLEVGPARKGPDGNQQGNWARGSRDGNQQENGLGREGPDGIQRKNRAFESADGNQEGNGRARESPFWNQQENGLAREGPSENQRENRARESQDGNQQENGRAREGPIGNQQENRLESASECVWSLYDDLLFDTLYSEATEPLSKEQAESSESQPEGTGVERGEQGSASCKRRKRAAELPECRAEGSGVEKEECKRRKLCRPMRSHLASGVWNLSREQGNKLLASRFKDDCLYICDWPGCVHVEEKRNYMLFRGVFKNFKRSRVWQNINDWSRSKIDLNCAYCSSKQTWDLLSSFCLRSYFGFHDDGQPQVRAYVCENGHVSGAWTDWPLYT